MQWRRSYVILRSENHAQLDWEIEKQAPPSTPTPDCYNARFAVNYGSSRSK